MLTYSFVKYADTFFIKMSINILIKRGILERIILTENTIIYSLMRKLRYSKNHFSKFAP
jgi:hypothetical protein